MIKGKILKKKVLSCVVACALCDDYRGPYTTSEEETIKHIKMFGWYEHPKHGWICGKCKKSL